MEVDGAKVDNPNICMHCHNTGEQKILFSFKTGGIHDDYYGVMLSYCYYCQSTSFHYLARSDEDYSFYFIEKSIPELEDNTELSDYIRKTFPSFSKIYSQSQVAEEEGLDLISGMGYRKAVEFLVSDYLINFQKDDPSITETWISSPLTSLNNKIQKLNDENLKALSTAITWIGNDETHYSKRNPDYDISEMKKFINALLAMIEYNRSIEDAKNFINRS
ncbi:hypothetical protein FC70_GL000497 [Paucilactobacillus oligofermentans DSM 15707 = LMG 22743]|uniref:Uncharacterized protein n=1 Tax=Paucilactobacillus oligofermentans DSM 15707 = LMG 22743 TaxID=1423778 RepID=A0A0R1RRU4_9LACO|nr:hypothetical protein FC70_GL000497 [Paucilactobacillus oligofermentans DSM 15707 = LMG 22743]